MRPQSGVTVLIPAGRGEFHGRNVAHGRFRIYIRADLSRPTWEESSGASERILVDSCEEPGRDASLCAGSEELLLQLPRPELKFSTISGFFPLSLTYTHTPTRLSHINTYAHLNFTPSPTIRFNYTHVDRHTCGQTDTRTQSYSCKLNTHTPLFQTLVIPSLIVGDQPGMTGANRPGATPCPEQWAHCPGSRESVSCGLAIPRGIDVWKKPHLFLPEEPSAVRSVFTGAVTRPFHCTELWVGSAGAAHAPESTGFEGRCG